MANDKRLFRKSRFFEPNETILSIIYRYVVLIIFCVITVYPILNILSVSLRPSDRILSTSLAIIPSNAVWTNYIQAFTEKPILKWIFNSFTIDLIATCFTMLVSVLAGYAFSRWKFKGRQTGLMTLLVTQMFPPPLALLPLTILLGNIGLIGNMWGLLIPYIATTIPFTTWLMKGFFDTIPFSMEESAYVDGASVFYTFRKIILPLSRPAIAVSAIFCFIGYWAEYIVARIIINMETDYTLPLGLMIFRGEQTTKWGMYSAGALVTTLPVMIMFILISKYIVGNMTLGGVKE